VDTRVEVMDTEIAAAFSVIGEAFKKRLQQHGKKSFIGPHEILGIIEEEVSELKEAVRSNKRAEVISELIDVGVGTLFGVASLMAVDRSEMEGEPQT
jgi:NTP pyrophosphatase (non-canonical NTP hydrolase)